MIFHAATVNSLSVASKAVGDRRSLSILRRVVAERLAQRAAQRRAEEAAREQAVEEGVPACRGRLAVNDHFQPQPGGVLRAGQQQHGTGQAGQTRTHEHADGHGGSRHARAITMPPITAIVQVIS